MFQGSIHLIKRVCRPFVAIYTVGWIKWLYGGKRPLPAAKRYQLRHVKIANKQNCQF